MNPAGKVAIVTGAGSGLGRATTAILVECGVRVLAVDINEQNLQALQEHLAPHVAVLVADVSDEADARQAVQATVAQFGALHIAVNCAGVADSAKTISGGQPHPSALWNKVIAVNLAGTFYVAVHAALAMSSNAPDAHGERGVIVNTASGAAEHGQVGQLAYSASKAGVIGMTLPMARDLAPSGIRVVAIAPGLFDTAMASGLSDRTREGMKAMFLFPDRMGEPGEFAGLVRHIVENRYLNATTISIDGGTRPSTR